MFKLLTAKDPSHREYLNQMHNMRYRILYLEKNWRDGLQIRDEMEFDEYNTDDAVYIVRINADDKVDACVRLIPTDKPTLLWNSFPHYPTKMAPPNSAAVYDSSHYCTDGKKIFVSAYPQILACMLEFGLKMGVHKYTAMSDVRLLPRVENNGWKADRIGEEHDTPTETCVGCSYEVTQQYHDAVKAKLGLSPNDTMITG